MQTNQKKDFKDLGVRFGLDFIVMFGSKADNLDTARSDIDIAIKPRHAGQINDDQLFSIDRGISTHFPDKELDLIIMGEDTSPLLMKEISDNGVVLYEREEGLFPERGWRVAKIYDDYRFISRHVFDDMRHE